MGLKWRICNRLTIKQYERMIKKINHAYEQLDKEFIRGFGKIEKIKQILHIEQQIIEEYIVCRRIADLWDKLDDLDHDWPTLLHDFRKKL